MARPMANQGDPDATTCRHCEAKKVGIRRILFCLRCDAPEINGSKSAKATWEPES